MVHTHNEESKTCRMVVTWSDEDQCWLAGFPEIQSVWCSHGDTVVEAVDKGLKVLDNLGVNRNGTLDVEIEYN